MPNPTEVVIIKRDGSITPYTTYGSARADAVSGDLIQIRADLLNEQIVLKDLVDIWIMPGVVINNTTGDTITNPIVSGVSQEVHCKISGHGIIKNTGSYRSIFIDNVDSELSIECDYIENSGSAICVQIKNAFKFNITCNKVHSQKNVAIWLGEYVTTLTGFVEQVNINISKVESGIPGFGSSVFISHCNGFININEIQTIYAKGHCFSHRAGEVIARIKKLKTVMNTTGSIATVHTDQGTGSQKLVLYFDEILNLNGIAIASSIAIHHHQGTGIFIGRRIYSKDNNAVDIGGDNIKGSIICNEIVSDALSGVRIEGNNAQFTIDAAFIEGYSFYGSIYAQGDANLLLKNAKLINRDSSSSSRCFVLESLSSQIPRLTVRNVKAVTGNTSSGSIFYQANFSGINIFNYGLFTNKSLDSGVTLDIGNTGNFVFIESNDLT